MNKLLNKFSNSTVLYNRTFSDSKGFYKMNKHRESPRDTCTLPYTAHAQYQAHWPHGHMAILSHAL